MGKRNECQEETFFFFSHSKLINILCNIQEFKIIVTVVISLLIARTCVFSCESWKALNKPLSSGFSSKSFRNPIQSWANRKIFHVVLHGKFPCSTSWSGPSGCHSSTRKRKGKSKERITTVLAYTDINHRLHAPRMPGWTTQMMVNRYPIFPIPKAIVSSQFLAVYFQPLAPVLMPALAAVAEFRDIKW